MKTPILYLREKMQYTVATAFQHQDFCMEYIIGLMQSARELFEVDDIVLFTNREYKYQLDLIVDCGCDGVKVRPGQTILMTKDRYHKMVDAFIAEKFPDISLPELNGGYPGDILRCGIMQNDHCFGYVAFCSLKKRTWTADEKTALSEICYLLLVFFGLNNLQNEASRFDKAKQKFDGKTISSGFFLNIKSGKCHAVKLAPFLQERIGEWEDYQQMIEDYIGYYVDPVYGQQIRRKVNIHSLKRNLSPQNPIVSLDFPRVVDGNVVWFRYVIELFSCDENDVPEKAYFYFRDITKELQLKSVTEINDLAYAFISAIDLETEQYAVYVNNLTSDMKNADFLSYGNYRELVREAADRAIAKEYAGRFLELFSLDRLREHFADSGEPLHYIFPYHTGNKTFWVKMDALKTTHFADNGNKIVLYFSDVTEQKMNELRLRAVSEELEKEHEQVVKAKQQAMRDPLTGVYNRAGFERAVRRYREERIPVGLVLIDVDNFKTMNDTYGHDFGDEVLVLISQKLQNSFRNEDRVFRLGGDEFALLLHKCSEDAWDSLQSKFENIYSYLDMSVKKDVAVTLSVGFCQSDDGYHDELLKLADEALYHIKSLGRSGLAQISKDHKILHTWRREENPQHPRALSEMEAIGRWRAEIDKDETVRPRLFLDEASRLVLGVSGSIKAEECFAFWKKHVVARYMDLCSEALVKLQTVGQAECIYHWNHPTKGEIVIHAVVKAHENMGTTEIYGYMREMEPSDIVLNYDDDQFLMQAFNKSYFCTYYFNLNSKDYFIVKGHENEPDVKERHKNVDETFRTFADTFVHPDFRQKVIDFLDLTTLPERLKGRTYIDCEYKSVTALGWCRTRIMPVKWDEQGNLTHAVSMSEGIDDAKREELEKEASVKNAMALQLRVGEIISKTTIAQTAIIDTKSGETKIWPDALFMDNYLTGSFEQMRNWGRLHVYKEDVSVFDTDFVLPHIMEKAAEDGAFELSARFVREDGSLSLIAYHFEAMKDDSSKLLMVIEDISDADGEIRKRFGAENKKE